MSKIDDFERDHHYEEFDDSRLHEECVHQDDAFQHVIANDWEQVCRAVDEHRADEWFESSGSRLELLNIVSGYDREQLREAVRRGIGSDDRREEDGPPQSQLFAVASEVSKFLESNHSPFAGRYGVGENLTWVVDLIELTRAFRDLLLALPEPKDGQAPASTAQTALDRLNHQHAPLSADSATESYLQKLNAALQEGMVFRFKKGVTPVGPKEKKLRFHSEVNGDLTSLHVALAYWMLEYLTTHIEFIQLAVCVECGRVFARERRDNVYCSKTCQNRVAYKRKKILEARVLREIEIDPFQILVDPAARTTLRPGLCLYHPRLGLGVVEAVRYQRRIRIQTRTGTTTAETQVDLPENMSPEEFVEKLKESGQRVDTWDVQVKPSSISAAVRFLPTVRRMSITELLGKQGEGGPTFYEVEDATRLSQLL